MAQLEKLKKADLVKLARELRQENKILKMEVENVNNKELDDSKLPLTAATVYRKGDSEYVMEVLKYSPESSNVKLEKQMVESTKELALYRLQTVIAERFYHQNYNKESKGE
jgi:hypothetical protein